VIDGLVVAGERVDPGAAELAQELVELVRHRVGVGLRDDRRDLAIDRRLLARGGRPLALVQRLEPLLQRRLGRPVGGPEPLGPLEQHMLEVVRHPGLARRVVARTRPHHHRAEHLRPLTVDAHHHRQPVAEHPHLDIQRIDDRGRRCRRGRGRRCGCRHRRGGDGEEQRQERREHVAVLSRTFARVRRQASGAQRVVNCERCRNCCRSPRHTDQSWPPCAWNTWPSGSAAASRASWGARRSASP
jgi:hypothetical protein